eukprot:319766-Rhodomonas_salina.4
MEHGRYGNRPGESRRRSVRLKWAGSAQRGMRSSETSSVSGCTVCPTCGDRRRSQCEEGREDAWDAKVSWEQGGKEGGKTRKREGRRKGGREGR